MHNFKLSILSIFLILITTQVSATHIRGGYIQFESVEGSISTQKITVFLLSDTDSGVTPGGSGVGTINFGDGTILSLTENASPPIVTIINDKSQLYAYEIVHTYSGSGTFVISYGEPNRNAGVINMSNSVDTPFYTESVLSLDSFLGVNSSPISNNPHHIKVLEGTKMLYNPTFFDKNGDSLSYHLAIPKQAVGTDVFNYISPADPSFYQNFEKDNETNDSIPTLTLSPFDGNLIWNAPRLEGEYSLALKVKEWRSINNEVFNISSTTYDLQVVVDKNPEEVNRPEITIPNSSCYEENLNEVLQVVSNNELIKVEIFTDAEQALINNVPFNKYVGPTDFTSENFNVTYSLNSSQASQEYHQVIVKVSQKLNNGTVHSWSQGFVYGFGCETIIRTITSFKEKETYKIRSFYQNGSIFMKTGVTSSEFGKVYLYNASGKLIFLSNEKRIDRKMEFKISQQKRGLYVFAFDSPNLVYRDKLIIVD